MEIVEGRETHVGLPLRRRMKGNNGKSAELIKAQAVTFRK